MRDGQDLLVTDLASGRLYRRGPTASLPLSVRAFPMASTLSATRPVPYRVVRAGDVLVVAQGWTPVGSDEGPFDHALVALDARR